MMDFLDFDRETSRGNIVVFDETEQIGFAVIILVTMKGLGTLKKVVNFLVRNKIKIFTFV